ncbi:hypothetical protein CSKR_101155, partial [Clonorchis sinensis]
ENSSESLFYDVLQLNVLHTSRLMFQLATECAAPGRLMFQLARYSRCRNTLYRRNTLLIRLLKTLRQPQEGRNRSGCAAQKPPHVSVGMIVHISQYILSKETTHEFSEKS